MKKPKIALVLSGGAALGFAHIGVIEVLEENGIEFDIITGTSMGAIVGGGYAMGISAKQMKTLSYKMRASKFFDLNFNFTGFFSGKRLMRFLKSIYGDVKIEDLPKAYACISVDLNTGELCVHKSGKLVEGIRGSMNIPGLFVPYDYNGKMLIDGGIINNFPDDVAKDMGADIIIGVDVLSKNFHKGKPKNIMQSFSNVVFLTNKRIRQLSKNYCDVLIEPYEPDVSQHSFSLKCIKKSIEYGREACLQTLPEIKKVLGLNS